MTFLMQRGLEFLSKRLTKASIRLTI